LGHPGFPRPRGKEGKVKVHADRYDTAAVRRWLDDIHYDIVLAQKFAEGMTVDALRDDLRTIYAVTRCLEIISEASRRLTAELKARDQSIQWLS
jgi:uncharacterized protein with HEPN domain